MNCEMFIVYIKSTIVLLKKVLLFYLKSTIVLLKEYYHFLWKLILGWKESTIYKE